MMKDFTLKSADAKVINSPEYQEYLEFLEEEAMSKNPDDFCFEQPNRNSYTKEDFNVFEFMNDQHTQGMQIISAAI
jgi:hypothetical protein